MVYYNHPHHCIHLKTPHTIDVKRSASYMIIVIKIYSQIEIVQYSNCFRLVQSFLTKPYKLFKTGILIENKNVDSYQTYYRTPLSITIYCILN